MKALTWVITLVGCTTAVAWFSLHHSYEVPRMVIELMCTEELLLILSVIFKLF